jgi:hypothetical protein
MYVFNLCNFLNKIILNVSIDKHNLLLLYLFRTFNGKNHMKSNLTKFEDLSKLSINLYAPRTKSFCAMLYLLDDLSFFPRTMIDGLLGSSKAKDVMVTRQN